MCAISGLIGGSQIFRQDDPTGHHSRGLHIMIGLVSFGLVFGRHARPDLLFGKSRHERTATGEFFLGKNSSIHIIYRGNLACAPVVSDQLESYCR